MKLGRIMDRQTGQQTNIQQHHPQVFIRRCFSVSQSYNLMFSIQRFVKVIAHLCPTIHNFQILHVYIKTK